MVFFTCSHCGESLKKSKVEKHYQTVCSRNPVAVTCVDCCKDFSAETYPAHTKCVSEEEKYSAKGFVSRPSANKGEIKQKKWQDIIQSLQENQKNLTHDEQTILNAIVNRENVPRKKPKFQNFLRSTMKNRYNAQAAESVFDKLEALGKEGELRDNQDNQKQGKSSKEDEKENTDTIDLKEDEVNETDDNPIQEKTEEKLSKKERKERQKRAKYEAELKEIESNQIFEAKGMNENEGRKRKKTKKGVVTVSAENGNAKEGKERSRKKYKGNVAGKENGVSDVTEMNEGRKLKNKHKGTVVMENDISEDYEVAEGKKLKKRHKKEAGVLENGGAEIGEGSKSKKKRKMCQDGVEDVCGEEPAKKKLKEDDTEDVAEEESIHAASGKTKFNLQEIIIKVLESKDSKELPLKRLRKKVLAEFEATGGGSASDVKMITKFNKKIHKISGVVVHKEVAKLVMLN